MKQVHTKRERDYYPHHSLFGAARVNLELAEKKESGWHYFEMASILFAGLAVEALANSFGDRYVKNWKDYESSSPLAKIQIVSRSLGVEYNDGINPWCHLRWLIRFRNRLAHAKPEMIKIEKMMSEKEWDKVSINPPNSKIEREINLKNAQRAIKAARSVRDLFVEKIPEDDFSNLIADGWSGESSYKPTIG